MGSCISQEPEVDFDGPVNFNHFHILRAIGKGAFGKVCIVKKKDTKQMYAMKYMNKIQIIRKHAVDNVFREIKILRSLEHIFLVNLWFTFQDREDMFMVLDLMLGGDISYHLEKAGKFNVQRVCLYIAELSLALEYLRSKSIIHRDIKPANMLLDSQGHVHITDFNVAAIVRPDATITSVTGTKPYMAPEVINGTSSKGYSYAVDWWSLGVSAYEMLRGHRPFNIEKSMSNSAIHHMLMHTRPLASASWGKDTCDVLKMLLHPDEDKRLQRADIMRRHPFFSELSWEEVENKTATPSFIPPQNRINCDPTHELEEMIVEPNPLHKKRHRLSKRSFRTEEDAIERELDKINNKFKEYNRQREKEAEEKEAAEKLASDQLEEQSSVKRLIEDESPSEVAHSDEVTEEVVHDGEVTKEVAHDGEVTEEVAHGGEVTVENRATVSNQAGSGKYETEETVTKTEEGTEVIQGQSNIQESETQPLEGNLAMQGDDTSRTEATDESEKGRSNVETAVEGVGDENMDQAMEQLIGVADEPPNEAVMEGFGDKTVPNSSDNHDQRELLSNVL